MPSYPHFPENCTSLLCKYLTPTLFEKLRNRKTPSGFTLMQAINSGVQNPESAIGVYAGDEASYEVFSPLFNPIIQEYHGFGHEDHHQSDMDSTKLKATDLDPENKYIISTRIRVGRNLNALPLGPGISKEQRLHVEDEVSSALLSLQGTLQGNYFPLEGMSDSVQKQLIEDHFLFKAGDRFLEAAGLNRDWPSGRGIFHNREKTFLVWVNEEDQLRIISMQQGGDIKAVFERLVSAIGTIEKQLTFMHSEHLGYITSCPTNLGTAMRASVHIKLPKLSQNKEQFQAITEQYHLQIRGIHGEHSESEAAIFDISNRRRLGITEVACVQDMHDGVAALIAAEEKL